jgi:hypothetical protein
MHVPRQPTETKEYRMPPQKKPLKRANAPVLQQQPTNQGGDDDDDDDDTEVQDVQTDTTSDNPDGAGDDTEPDDEEAPEEGPPGVDGNEDPNPALKAIDDRTAPAYQQRFPGAPRDAAVFEAGENIIVKAKTQGDLVVVQEPVYRATKPPGSRRWRFHLLYSRGATLAKVRVKQIGKPGTDEEKKASWPYEVKDSGYFSA